MRRWGGSLAWLTLVMLAVGCGSAEIQPGTIVPVMDVRSLAGKWVGTLIDARNMGTPMEMIIGKEGTYSARFGATRADGTVAMRDGQLEFTMTQGTGLLGPAEAASTAVLYDRGGQRVLVGNGRWGFRERPFSWEVTEQR